MVIREENLATFEKVAKSLIIDKESLSFKKFHKQRTRPLIHRKVNYQPEPFRLDSSSSYFSLCGFFALSMI